MLKTLDIKITFDTTTNTLNTTSEVEGFDALEILGLLELRKQDIMQQLYNPNEFERVRKYENGESDKVIYKGNE